MRRFLIPVSTKTVSALALSVASGFPFSGCSKTSSTRGQHASTAQKQTAPNPCGASAKAPNDISLHISLKNGQTVFHQGEIVVFTTTYSATTRKKYSVWSGNAVGSPIFGDGELYCLSPDVGVTDNLFEGAIWPGIGGAGSTTLGMGDPAIKPMGSDLELNNPRTFIPGGRSLPAGKYAFRVISQRVTPAVKDIFQRPPKERIPVTSNTVEFEVRTDTEWQAQQYAEEAKVLNSRSAPPWKKSEAIHKLRFLDTEASVRELADHFHSFVDTGDQAAQWATVSAEQWDIAYALFGSRHRDAAIDDMRAALQNPHRLITQDFASLLAALEMQTDPRFRVPKSDQIEKGAFASAVNADKAEFDRRVQAYLKLASAPRGVANNSSPKTE